MPIKVMEAAIHSPPGGNTSLTLRFSPGVRPETILPVAKQQIIRDATGHRFHAELTYLAAGGLFVAQAGMIVSPSSWVTLAKQLAIALGYQIKFVTPDAHRV